MDRATFLILVYKNPKGGRGYSCICKTYFPRVKYSKSIALNDERIVNNHEDDSETEMLLADLSWDADKVPRVGYSSFELIENKH